MLQSYGIVTPGIIAVKTWMNTARGMWLLWGLAAVACYLASVWVIVRPVPVRILYEGMAPIAPYRWVKPPTNLAASNEPPKPWTGSIAFRANASEPSSFATGDGQMIAVFRQGAVAPRDGETAVRVTLTPLDAESLAPAPAGSRYDGNAYRIDAVYGGSGVPAALRLPMTVVLRYARHSESLLRLDEPTWTPLSATAVPESMQIFAMTDRLGVFVAAGPPLPGVVSPLWAYAASVVVLLLAGLAFLRGRRAVSKGSGVTSG